VQVPVAVEGVAPSQAYSPHRAGEGVRETGASAGAGTQRTAGLRWVPGSEPRVPDVLTRV
jgi:hypothetical protein